MVMSDSTTIRILRLAAALAVALMLTPSPSAVAADNTVEVNVSGGVVHKIHGIETIGPQLFGMDRGSGGISGWKEMNCQWFRNTSIIPLSGIKEDPKSPGHPDPAWLESHFPSTGTGTKRPEINSIDMFMPRPAPDEQMCFQPFSGPEGNAEACKSWAQAAAHVVASELRPYADGTISETMFEMGNEMMYPWVKSPYFQIDSTRFSPAAYGANDAKAYRQWVYYTAKAIKGGSPQAKILGGAGDMALAGFNWWGWNNWDRPFLDLCAPYVDYYVTHWYDQDPMEIILEAGLVRAYTDQKFGKPLSTQITESGLACSGPEAPMPVQWSRLQYSGSVKFAAFRDPDKVSGIYDFLWSAPNIPYWTIKGSLLEKWMQATRNLRGQTILTQSSSESVLSAATQGDQSLVAVAENFGDGCESVLLKISAPKGRKITGYDVATVNFDASSDKPSCETKTIQLASPASEFSCPVKLSAGGTVAITAMLDGQAGAERVVSTDEFTSYNFLVAAGQPIQVNVTRHRHSGYALLRMAVENKTSHWSDLWVKLNGKLYQMPCSFWRRPCRLFEVSVDPAIIRKKNTIVLVADPSSEIRAVTTAIELSDVPMAYGKPRPMRAMAQIQAPAATLQGGKSYPVSVVTHAGKESALDPSRIVWSLPDGWEMKPAAVSNGQCWAKLTIPPDAVVDWYPLSAKMVIGGERINLNTQVHVITPIECEEFKTAPTIDGDLAEWAGHKSYEILTPTWQYRRLVWMPGHRQYQHTGKSMRFGWSKDGFYFAAEMEPRQKVWSDKWNYRKHDWVELYFDLLDDRKWFTYGREGYQFGVALSDNGEAVVNEPIWVGSAPKYTVKPLPGAVVKWVQKAGRIVLEGFIPANAFEAWAPRQISTIGFDFRIGEPFDWYGRGYEAVLDQVPTAFGWGQEQVMTCPALWASMEFK